MGVLLAGASGARADIEPTSMRFEWVTEGPAETCADRCREWVAATGPITTDTLGDFDTFSQMRPLRGATLVLDSGGGAVVPSLELGRRIRSFAMATTVGRTIRLPGPATGPGRARLSPAGDCASMCVFVLLGGAERRVPAEARLLVHQIWPGAKRYDASAESYTAEEIMRIQRDAGQIARYTVEMGADIELFELAMRNPPWERLRALSPAELRRIGVQLVETPPEPPISGAAAEPRGGDKRASAAAERGWRLTDTARRGQALARHHILTIEGEEIGAFEIAIGCQSAADDTRGAYRVNYSETRKASALPGRRGLTDVTLVFGGERVSLVVDGPGVRLHGVELETTASGSVPAAFVEQLRRNPNAVLSIRTEGGEGEGTSIRLGATGFAAAFPRFAAGCRTDIARAN